MWWPFLIGVMRAGLDAPSRRGMSEKGSSSHFQHTKEMHKGPLGYPSVWQPWLISIMEDELGSACRRRTQRQLRDMSCPGRGSSFTSNTRRRCISSIVISLDVVAVSLVSWRTNWTWRTHRSLTVRYDMFEKEFKLHFQHAKKMHKLWRKYR